MNTHTLVAPATITLPLQWLSQAASAECARHIARFSEEELQRLRSEELDLAQEMRRGMPHEI